MKAAMKPKELPVLTTGSKTPPMFNYFTCRESISEMAFLLNYLS